jgi:hypothetical protein
MRGLDKFYGFYSGGEWERLFKYAWSQCSWTKGEMQEFCLESFVHIGDDL